LKYFVTFDQGKQEWESFSPAPGWARMEIILKVLGQEWESFSGRGEQEWESFSKRQNGQEWESFSERQGESESENHSQKVHQIA
jgi:hypothetical protein